MGPAYFGLVLLTVGMLSAMAISTSARAQTETPFSATDIAHILRHGPWPSVASRDPSNRVSGHPAAAALGRALFFDRRLSANGEVSCATCHLPHLAFTDGRARAHGRVRLDRNTPGLWNVAQARWFGWDGGADSLWAFAIRPMLNPDEMAASPPHVAALLRGDGTLACLYARSFGKPPDGDPERLLADAAKALAAYLETLVSGKSSFDLLRDALVRGDDVAAANYPKEARRGLSLFFGRGQCSVCHFGANFSNGEFHDIGIPYLVEPGRVDPGRYGGIARVVQDRFNRLGRFSDDAGASADHIRHVVRNHTHYGQFKVPSLRNVALTAPYMHDGRLKTLHEVVRHYSDLPEDRLHQDGEALLKPLRLSPDEVDALVAFLQTLTSREFPKQDMAAPVCTPPG